MNQHKLKLRIAFVKFAGLAAGGTERWLQTMAANLPKDRFEVDYYYCDAASYVGSDYRHADTDPARMIYMRNHGVNLIKFSVGAKDVTIPTHDWVNTNFWEVFNPAQYDLVQTAKAGPPEYPYFKIPLPVVEYVTLSAGVDQSPNIACSIHLSQWQRAQWFRAGGNLARSAVIAIPAEPPCTHENLRAALGIPSDALVAGFHQRADENIFSPIPLRAFQKIACPERHFIIMGGGKAYRQQAEKLRLLNVHFVPHSGEADQISRFLNTLDIFAHGRQDGETFGTIFAEAMMHGKPCLSHRSAIANAQPETMGPAGLFAEDEADYTQKLQILFADAPLRMALGSKGLRHANDYYSVDACVNRLADIYMSLGKDVKSALAVEQAPVPYGQTEMGFLYAGYVDRQADIANCVMTGGCPEEFCIDILRYFLPHTRVMLDVGANTGLYCWVAAHEGRDDLKIQVYEPQADLCQIMERTVTLNNWENRVTINALALGAGEGVGELHVCGSGSTLDNSFNDNADLPKQTVHIDTLDNQVLKLGKVKVDFIKINVEGFEQAVLEGARSLLIRDQPVLFIEIADKVRNRVFRNKNYHKTLKELHRLGYVILRADEDKLTLRQIKPETDDGHDHIAMYLCVPENIWPTHRLNLRAHINAYKRKKTLSSIRRMLSRLDRLMARSNPKRIWRKIFA